MAEVASSTAAVVLAEQAEIPKRQPLIYDKWVESLGIPVYRSFALEDATAVPLGWWADRGCNAAIVQLVGQEGISEAKIVEIPPGETLPPFRSALDELAFVLAGRGLASVWAEDREKRSFEWGESSLFVLPANYSAQMSNAQGDRPARLLLFNNLPVAMSVVGSADWLLKNTYADTDLLYGAGEGTFYSEAVQLPSTRPGERSHAWRGNFFPDLRVWDKLENQRYRGGGQRVHFRFTGAANWAHMATFPPGTYKKAHRHGPGVVIVVLEGEGYSLLRPEKGADMVMARWKKGGIFVPPNEWWHQHFNVGSTPARYLAFHGATGLPGRGDWDANLGRDQIEFPDEDPQIRRLFEDEVRQRGFQSLMPEQVYRDRTFEFTLGKGGD